MFLALQLSSLWGWMPHFLGSCPRCVDGLWGWGVDHFFFKYHFFFKTFSLTFWVYAELNSFLVERSHFPLYKSGEQWQGSCSWFKQLCEINARAKLFVSHIFCHLFYLIPKNAPHFCHGYIWGNGDNRSHFCHPRGAIAPIMSHTKG